MILAFGTAFVGPLRLIAPVEPVAFQLTGPGGTGRTIIGAVVSSIWGQRSLGGKPHPLGSGDAWNNTVNNLERVLATRNHTFLFLDETHLARPEDIIAAIFMISEGQGRGRYNELRRWEWFVPVLSTSNDSVAEILDKAREPADRAAFDRLVDVPLPKGRFGAFENPHGSATVGEFVLRLKAIALFFARKIKPMGVKLGKTSVEKAWNKYRTVAPYIYALYPTLYFNDGHERPLAEMKKITEGSVVLPSSPRNQPSRNVWDTQHSPLTCW